MKYHEKKLSKLSFFCIAIQKENHKSADFQHPLPIPQRCRSKDSINDLIDDPSKWIEEDYTGSKNISKAFLCCAWGVWRYTSLTKENSSDLLFKDRSYSCFFYKHEPGMLVEAAKILQEREEENRQLKNTIKYTQIGLWIAAGALLSNCLFELIKMGLNQ